MAPVRKPGLAFGIATPADMLAKLGRERDRAADASFYEEDLTDHGVNFALTAWHITDWVWQLRLNNDKAACAELFSKYPDLQTQDRPECIKFKEFVTRECRQLALCQDIANGFKHVEATPSAHRQATGAEDTTASAKTAPAGPFKFGSSILGVDGLGGPGYEADGQMYRLKIRGTDGKTVDAMTAFDAVVAYWTKFMAEHQLL